MGIFSKSNNGLQHKPGAIWTVDDQELERGVDYNSVIDWLCGLSDKDYAKTCEVASIYRKANVDSAKALGITLEVTEFINPPAPEEPEPNILEDDELESAFLDEPDFLEDEPKPKAKKKS